MKMILSLLTFTILTTAHSAQVDFKSTKSGKLNFEAVGRPAMIKIKGESAAPQTVLTFNDGKVYLESHLDLEQLDTGIDLRDEHMKEKYLETKKYPKAKLVITSLKLPADWEKNPTIVAEQEFEGTLNLHGKTSPVKGTFTLSDKKEANAEFRIKLTDFDIEIPEYLGVKVADLVTIKTQIQLERQ